MWIIDRWDLRMWLVYLLVSQPTILRRIFAASSWKKVQQLYCLWRILSALRQEYGLR